MRTGATVVAMSLVSVAGCGADSPAGPVTSSTLDAAAPMDARSTPVPAATHDASVHDAAAAIVTDAASTDARSTHAPFGNETLHADRISFYMVPDLEGPYTGNWAAVEATFAKLHQLMPDAWVRWDNETGHNTNTPSQVSQLVSAAEAAAVPMVVTASAFDGYNNMWAEQYVTSGATQTANGTILQIAGGPYISFAQQLLAMHSNVKLVETLNEPDGPNWFVTDYDDAADFDVYMSAVYKAMSVTPGNAASAASLVGPSVAFGGSGKIWGDWMARSELANVSYHTYGEPARAGLHDWPGKAVYVTEYGFQTTTIAPAVLLDDLWNIEKGGLFSGTIKKVFYDQLLQNGSNPSAFSQSIESGQSHFAIRGWFRALAAWARMAQVSPSALRDDAHPDYLATDDQNGQFAALLWNDSGTTETGQTRTVHGTSPAPGAALHVLHVVFAGNADTATAKCSDPGAQNVVSATVGTGTVTVTVESLGPQEAVLVSTAACDDLAN